MPRKGGGGGGYATNASTEGLRPEVQPLTLLYTIFHEKGSPFTNLVKNFVSLLTVVNGLSSNSNESQKLNFFSTL